MESQQIVDYIATNIKTGHSEKQLRKHLMAYGWQKAAIDAAFKRYHASRRNGGMSRTRRRPTRLDRLKRRSVVFAAMAGICLMAGAIVYFWPHAKQLPIAKATPLSYSQQQVLDINTIGGAIGQYTAATEGILPSRLVAGTAAGSLVMCNTTCDPTTSQLSSLMVYKPQNVKLMRYVADLTVPDDQTVYVVPSATCKNTTTLGGPSSSPRAMIILYAANDGNSISQRCVTL